jgi:hypothetical protein
MSAERNNYLSWRNRTTAFLESNPSHTRICLLIRHMASALDKYEELSDLVDQMRYFDAEEDKALELAMENAARRADPRPQSLGLGQL